MNVATSIGISHSASPELVKKTVQMAIQRAGLDSENSSSANSLILLLTPAFVKDLQSSIQAAAVAARTTQIIGCMAPCIFTEEDWVTDAAGVAVMVFDDGLQWINPVSDNPNQPILTIAAPHALNTSWMTQPGVRFGAVAGDATGFGSYTVWQNGKGASESYVQKALQGVNVTINDLQELTPTSADFGLLFLSLSDLSLNEKSAARFSRPTIDEKLGLIKSAYGDLPLIGFLGNGQIAPSEDAQRPCVIHSNTSLLALCKACQ